jgi:uncharacterized membrane protein
MDWFAYSLIGATSITLFSLFVRKYLYHRHDAREFACLTNLVASLTLLLFFIIDAPQFSISALSIGLLIVSSILYASAGILYSTGRQLEEVSNVSIMKQAESVWALLVGLLLLGEELSLYKLIGVGLILLGTSFVIYRGHAFKFSKGMIYILVGTFVAGISALIDKVLLGNSFSPALYGAIIFGLSSFWIFLTIPNKIIAIKQELTLQNEHLLTVGILLAVSAFSVMKAFMIGEISRILPVLNVSLVFIVIAGIIFFKERDNMVQKLIGAGIAFAGLFFLR